MRTRLIRAAAPAPAAGRERSAGAQLHPARLTLLLLPLMAIKVFAQADDRTGTELRPPAARSLNATSDAESRRQRTTVSTAQLSALATSAQGKLRVGRITIKLDQAMRDDLRALADQLTAGYP